jgi:hypothetical protein
MGAPWYSASSQPWPGHDYAKYLCAKRDGKFQTPSTKRLYRKLKQSVCGVAVCLSRATANVSWTVGESGLSLLWRLWDWVSTRRWCWTQLAVVPSTQGSD